MSKRTSIMLNDTCVQLLDTYNSTLPAGVELSIGKVLNSLLTEYLEDRLREVSSDTPAR